MYFFLHFRIEVNNDSTDPWIWCKPTHTGLLLNYNKTWPKK